MGLVDTKVVLACWCNIQTREGVWKIIHTLRNFLVSTSITPIHNLICHQMIY